MCAPASIAACATDARKAPAVPACEPDPCEVRPPRGRVCRRIAMSRCIDTSDSGFAAAGRGWRNGCAVPRINPDVSATGPGGRRPTAFRTHAVVTQHRDAPAGRPQDRRASRQVQGGGRAATPDAESLKLLAGAAIPCGPQSAMWLPASVTASNPAL